MHEQAKQEIYLTAFGTHAHTHTHLVGREYVGPVRFERIQHAVGRDEDAPWEMGEVALLLVPGAAVMPRQVRVLVQAGVAMRRQHLPVCVHVDAETLGLLETAF